VGRGTEANAQSFKNDA